MTIPDGLKVVAYGGGVNTVALLILLRRAGVIPTAITMADPGSERHATYAYRDAVATPWLRTIGFPPITVVTRQAELIHRQGGKNYETLHGLCVRTASLPSVAYPPSKKCSLNYKAAPQRWWLDRQAWAIAEWATGRKLVRCIGYDTDEPKRIRPGFNHPDENRKAVPWYPVFEAGLDRTACVALIHTDAELRAAARVAAMPVVPCKSACKWCPNNSERDWHDLHAEDPAGFAEAIAMSRAAAATVESPGVVGLLRGFAPQGRRALHVWVDGGYGNTIGAPPGATHPPADDPDGDEMPCECST